LTDSYDYAAFGELDLLSGTTENEFLFTGEQYDPALELYYEPLAKLSPVGGQISNSHPADANEYYSRVLPKAVASFFSNRRGKAQIQRKGPTTRLLWRVFHDGPGG
jgi:hypothetical protein